jgi:hypothetical protein
MKSLPPHWQPWLLLAWVALLALFFAQVEIQIEGAAGWAASLPTWRIESHWLLDIVWGGRPMTGYHEWVFPFIALAFHLPVFVSGHWSWRLQMRIVAAIMLFWVIEDALWFVMNPAFGWAKLSPAHVPWHKHWWGPLPVDYWVSGTIGLALLFAASRSVVGDRRQGLASGE